jgi:hypothetical protein
MRREKAMKNLYTGKHHMKLFIAVTLLLSWIPVVSLSQTTTSDSGTNTIPALNLRRVYPGGVRPQLREVLQQMGDRLQRPGKERITYAGSLSLQSNPLTTNFQLTWEFPGRLRLDQDAEGKVDSLVYDGVKFNKTLGSPGSPLVNALETLLFDSPEHFFLGQANGLATRCLGDHARVDDGTVADYSGPFYNIYLVADQVGIRSKDQEQAKFFYFNSNTLLLEKVTYDLKQNGDPISVEVQYEDWKLQDGQQFPGKITRLENGFPTMTLVISSTHLGPQLNDGTFSIP